MVVGLCGGIGSGKTVVSDHFARLGINIIDTDIIAREIVAPGAPALSTLVEAFGDQILLADGQLDRDKLRNIAFETPENKAMLDSITHPAIRRSSIEQIDRSNTPYCLVVIPLLTAESPFLKLLDRVLVVTADTELKISRVQKRSNLSRQEVLRIMSSQISDEERLSFANDVIENNSTLNRVYADVEAKHQHYLALCEKV